MQYLEELQVRLHEYCHIANGFIVNQTGYDINLQQHCSKLQTHVNLHDHLISLTPILLLTLVLSIALTCLKKKGNKKTTFNATLVNVKEISHDTKIFTFDLPKGTNQIGLKVGEHLELEYN